MDNRQLTSHPRGDVKFSIVSGSTLGLAASYRDSAGRVLHRICINADLLWPLLVPTFTVSERAVFQILIARVVLHELCVSALG